MKIEKCDYCEKDLSDERLFDGNEYQFMYEESNYDVCSKECLIKKFNEVVLNEK